MNLPTSLEAVAVIILLFIPGYVFQQSMRRAIPFVSKAVDARYFFSLIVCGGVVHLLYAWWTPTLIDWYLDGRLRDHPVAVVIWIVTVVFVTPAILGPIMSWVLMTRWIDQFLTLWGLSGVQRTTTAWMYSTNLGPRWVRVYLKDGTTIGGLYESRSFSDDTGSKDIFLESVYNLDANGDFEDPVPGNVGIWIAHDTISPIMFFRLPEEGPRNGSITAGEAGRIAASAEDRE